MARTRSGLLSKINEATDAYERARKSTSKVTEHDENSFDSGMLEAAFADQDLDDPVLKNRASLGLGRTNRSEIDGDKLNAAKTLKAKRALKKAESEE